MSEDEKTQRDILYRSNKDYNDYNALQIRLNTDPITKQLEFYLRGWQQGIDKDDNGEPKIVIQQVSPPKANDEGVHSIMAWITATLNPQVVQGNIEDFSELGNYLCNYREDLAGYVMANRITWGLDIADFSGLIDMIMIQVKPFMSRLVKNKERESYANTIEHKEQTASTLRDRPRNGMRIPGLG